MDGQLSIDEEGQKTGRKEYGVYCSPGQIFVAILVSIAIAAAVGLLAFYLPPRICDLRGGSNGSMLGERGTPTPGPTDRTVTQKPIVTGVTPTQEPWMGRLPHNVWPLRYDVTLTPYLYPEDVTDGPGRRRFTFDGAVNIRVQCEEVTKVITLHINNITLEVLRVTSMTDPDAKDLVVGYEIDEYYQFLHIQLSEHLKRDENYEINMVYVGELWDGLTGFLSQYIHKWTRRRKVSIVNMYDLLQLLRILCMFLLVTTTTIRSYYI